MLEIPCLERKKIKFNVKMKNCLLKRTLHYLISAEYLKSSGCPLKAKL